MNLSRNILDLLLNGAASAVRCNRRLSAHSLVLHAACLAFASASCRQVIDSFLLDLGDFVKLLGSRVGHAMQT